MTYTEKQAQAKAQQIFDRFGLKVHLACANSIVEESFLAGFIGVEAGIDRNGQIREDAKRFEVHVYASLKAVRDGLKRSYNRITKADIANASDDALKNLATSFGMTQIMAWHLIKNLRGTVADLRDPEKHLFYAVELLNLTARKHLLKREYDSVLRIWNTGSANGKTYHADYVGNALKVKKYYEIILKANKNAFINTVSMDAVSTDTVSTDTVSTDTVSPKISSASGNVSQDDAISASMSDVNESDESTGSIVSDNNASTETTIKTDTVDITSSASAGGAKPVAKNFDALIPQIDTAKSYLKKLFSGSVLATIGAFMLGLPQWIQISLVVLVLIVVVGGIVIFARYYKDIFAFVTAMNTLRATKGVDNPILTAEQSE